MKRFLVSTLVITGVLMLVRISATCIAADATTYKSDPCRDITIQALKAQVPIPPASILSKRKVNGVCEVILDIRGQFVPIYAGENYVIAGEMYQERKQITQNMLNQLKAKRFRSLKPEIEKSVALVYKPGKEVKRTVYMITDPVCPYCHRAETRLKEFAAKYGAEFKMVLYSVHPPVGREKAIEAVCRKLTAEDYLKGDWKRDNKTGGYQCSHGIELIKRSETLARKLGVRGVPVFFLENGKSVVGANMPALARALSKPSDKAAKVSDAK